MQKDKVTLFIGVGGTGKKVTDGIEEIKRQKEAPVFIIDIDSDENGNDESKG